MTKPESGQFRLLRQDAQSTPNRIVHGFSTELNRGHQAKHIIGMRNYEIERAKGIHKSIFYGTIRDAQELVNQYAGSGRWIHVANANRELVDFHRVIGLWVDVRTGHMIPTTMGIIHYGKRGTHIVPSRPS